MEKTISDMTLTLESMLDKELNINLLSLFFCIYQKKCRLWQADNITVLFGSFPHSLFLT